MIIEEGQVVDLVENRARVRLARNDSCRSCGLCHFGEDEGGMILEVGNSVGATTGDRVAVKLEERDPLSAAGLLFGLPLLALLSGAGTGWVLARALGFPPDGGAVLFSAVFLAGAFFLIRYRELQRRDGAIRILRVVSRPGSLVSDLEQDHKEEVGL